MSIAIGTPVAHNGVRPYISGQASKGRTELVESLRQARQGQWRVHFRSEPVRRNPLWRRVRAFYFGRVA